MDDVRQTFCTECGSQFEKGLVFCTECGTKADCSEDIKSDTPPQENQNVLKEAQDDAASEPLEQPKPVAAPVKPQIATAEVPSVPFDEAKSENKSKKTTMIVAAGAVAVLAVVAGLFFILPALFDLGNEIENTLAGDWIVIANVTEEGVPVAAVRFGTSYDEFADAELLTVQTAEPYAPITFRALVGSAIYQIDEVSANREADVQIIVDHLGSSDGQFISPELLSGELSIISEDALTIWVGAATSLWWHEYMFYTYSINLEDTSYENIILSLYRIGTQSAARWENFDFTQLVAQQEVEDAAENNEADLHEEPSDVAGNDEDTEYGDRFLAEIRAIGDTGSAGRIGQLAQDFNHSDGNYPDWLRQEAQDIWVELDEMYTYRFNPSANENLLRLIQLCTIRVEAIIAAMNSAPNGAEWSRHLDRGRDARIEYERLIEQGDFFGR